MRDRILDDLLGIPEQTETLYDSLIPRRVNNLLLVTSLYDSYTFIEDGRLSEMLLNEFMELNLQYSPHIQRVSTALEALDLISRMDFDLVISMPRVGEMNVREFGERVQERAPGLPVILLASSLRELAQLQPLTDLKGIYDVFVWLGDVRLFLAMIKSVEDRLNAWHDARLAGVKCILVVEDNVPFYSANLPELYTEVMKQTLTLMAEGVNRSQRIIRRRARPKILLAHTFEQAMDFYGKYREDLVGVILDIAFPRGGRMDFAAGPAFAKIVAERSPDLPILVQSTSEFWDPGPESTVTFVDKRSPDLRQELRTFMQDYLGFGEFIFRNTDGAIVSKADDLRSLEWSVQAVPIESLEFHAHRGDFSKWLLVRTEFELSGTLARIIAQNPQGEDLRSRILDALHAHRARAGAGVVAEFSPTGFEGSSRFVRLGTGSLGGKGRGLAFVNSLITSYHLENRFPGIRIAVPPTLVLATSVFDQFMQTPGLRAFAQQEQDNEAITRAFLAADLPRDAVDALWTFLDWIRYPLAVRSSSLLEDASYQPFAGIYETYMIPNNEEDPELRLARLGDAVKRVYASTFHSEAKAYLQSTPNRVEEEKMAVVIQQMAGRRHGRYMYPDFAGVGRSLNFYPMPGMKPEEGVGSVALGLGKTVVDGGRCARFCPAQPAKPLQWFSPRDYLQNAQREFLALDLDSHGTGHGGMLNLATLDLAAAREHGTLYPVGGVYSPDNDAIYDGCSRPGVPLVTMAGVFKGGVFPLGEVLTLLLKAGAAANSCPVEMEFAVTLSKNPGEPHAFDFLQIRPMVMGTDAQDIPMAALKPGDAICTSRMAMGNGFLEGIQDLVYVRPGTFSRALTTRIASEVGDLNKRLKGRPYLLVGPGRWGSSDPWLGIPVAWSQIAGARCIVETDMGDMHVDPSQGSHFFQNLMAFGVGYLTVETQGKEDLLDFGWLEAQEATYETEHLRHLAFTAPLEVALNGRRNRGAVLKPGCSLRG
ncbi:PEP/pyruvate-binding domain-containing protein [Geothrix sp. 21YS21S-2]|uniref:PEP/pyruvate-binding domain-containing protein n=1 Tax=Geothrix sp. 21YS21S-2 TaxID=3068893 RepID=UPI0027B9B646|nr:PEP/pyruvate-binding domain-containing protein [Geothrix sp. 21YS21S-2]